MLTENDLKKATSGRFIKSCHKLRLFNDYEYDVLRSAFILGIKPENIANAYIGMFKSDEDFIYYILQSENVVIPRNIKYLRIDWSSTKLLIFQDYYNWGNYYFKRVKLC